MYSYEEEALAAEASAERETAAGCTCTEDIHGRLVFCQLCAAEWASWVESQEAAFLRAQRETALVSIVVARMEGSLTQSEALKALRQVAA